MKPPFEPSDGIRVVSWDVDGTLYSLPLFKARLVWTLLHRIPSWGFGDCWRTLRGIQELHGWIDAQRSVEAARVDRAGWESRREIVARETALFREVLPTLRLRKGVRTLLEHFRARGIPQVTLSDVEARYKLEALGVDAFFVERYHCVEIGFWKPSPVAFRAIQARFGARPEEHLHIGDRAISDGAGSRAAGCRFLQLD